MDEKRKEKLNSATLIYFHIEQKIIYCKKHI